MKRKPRPVPPWDDYLMMLAFMVASRSKDPSSQVGAVIVDSKHRIQGTGYNGPTTGMNDAELDWGRPAKYAYMIHAEANAIDHVTGHPDTLDGSTLYVTGPPCHECMKRILNKRIRKVVYGPQRLNMVDEEDWQKTKELVTLHRAFTLERYSGNLNWLRDRMAWMAEAMPEVFVPQAALPL